MGEIKIHDGKPDLVQTAVNQMRAESGSKQPPSMREMTEWLNAQESDSPPVPKPSAPIRLVGWMLNVIYFVVWVPICAVLAVAVFFLPIVLLIGIAYLIFHKLIR